MWSCFVLNRSCWICNSHDSSYFRNSYLSILQWRCSSRYAPTQATATEMEKIEEQTEHKKTNWTHSFRFHIENWSTKKQKHLPFTVTSLCAWTERNGKCVWYFNKCHCCYCAINFHLFSRQKRNKISLSSLRQHQEWLFIRLFVCVEGIENEFVEFVETRTIRFRWTQEEQDQKGKCYITHSPFMIIIN